MLVHQRVIPQELGKTSPIDSAESQASHIDTIDTASGGAGASAVSGEAGAAASGASWRGSYVGFIGIEWGCLMEIFTVIHVIKYKII